MKGKHMVNAMILLPFWAVFILLITTFGVKACLVESIAEIFDSHPCNLNHKHHRASSEQQFIFTAGMIISAILMAHVLNFKRILMGHYWYYPKWITGFFYLGTIGYITCCCIPFDIKQSGELGRRLRVAGLVLCVVAWPIGQIFDAIHWVKYLQSSKHKYSGSMPGQIIYFGLSFIMAATSTTLLGIGVYDAKQTRIFWAGYLISVFALLEYSFHGWIMGKNEIAKSRTTEITQFISV